MLLPGCSVQGVNPKIHLVMGRGAASALSGALDKTLDEKEASCPLISSRGSPGALSMSRLLIQ